MANTLEAPITGELLTQARNNYIDCLALPPQSKVLIITDLLPKRPNPNLLNRRKMADAIRQQLISGGQTVAMIEFDNSMDIASLYGGTSNALQQLDQANQTGNNTTTIVYLGDAYLNRRGIYQAASEFGEKRQVRIAGSLGFTTGDCRVVAEINSQKMAAMDAVNKEWENFFNEKPRGQFRILTTNGTYPYWLSVNYDTAKAPFETDMGKFDEEHKIMIGNFQYVNIPGGEKFCAPYPFEDVQGCFFAQGLLFQVAKGVIVKIDYPQKNPPRDLDRRQKTLIKLIWSGHQIPVAELGLGFYELAGISTYPDSSVLSREKTGPHIGIGHNVSGTPEAEAVAQLAGNFHHADFVLNNPIIIWSDENNQRKLFYAAVSPH